MNKVIAIIPENVVALNGDVMPNIFSNMEVEDIPSIKGTCKKWKQSINDNADFIYTKMFRSHSIKNGNFEFYQFTMKKHDGPFLKDAEKFLSTYKFQVDYFNYILVKEEKEIKAKEEKSAQNLEEALDLYGEPTCSIH